MAHLDGITNDDFAELCQMMEAPPVIFNLFHTLFYLLHKKEYSWPEIQGLLAWDKVETQIKSIDLRNPDPDVVSCIGEFLLNEQNSYDDIAATSAVAAKIMLYLQDVYNFQATYMAYRIEVES